MIRYFPEPYPDELLYSLAARYSCHIGAPHIKGLLFHLFGKELRLPSVDLPGNLDRLAAAVAPAWDVTGKHIAENYTLFPFYSAFLAPARAASLLESMLIHPGSYLHMKCGILMTSVRTPARMMFCPQCLEDDQQMLGESYWRRIHQVPGVLVCPTHGEWLQASEISYRAQHRRHLFPATRRTCHPSTMQPPLDHAELELALLVARKCGDLLQCQPPGYARTNLGQKYSRRAIALGFRARKGCVAATRLEDAFVGMFGENFLEQVGCPVSRRNQMNWLLRLLRKHVGQFHPLRHVLLQLFLERIRDQAGVPLRSDEPLEPPEPARPRSPRCGRPPEDWHRRDLELLTRARVLTDSVQGRTGRRYSKSGLARDLGCETLMFKSPQLIPKTAAFIAANSKPSRPRTATSPGVDP